MKYDEFAAYENLLLRDENKKLREALKRMVAIVDDYVYEVGPCDHSVNICCCDMKHKRDDAKLVLEAA